MPSIRLSPFIRQQFAGLGEQFVFGGETASDHRDNEDQDFRVQECQRRYRRARTEPCNPPTGSEYCRTRQKVFVEIPATWKLEFSGQDWFWPQWESGQ